MKFWLANTSGPGENAEGLKLEHSLTNSLQTCDEHSFTAFHCFYSPTSCIFSRLRVCVFLTSYSPDATAKKKDDEKKVERGRVSKTCESVREIEMMMMMYMYKGVDFPHQGKVLL